MEWTDLNFEPPFVRERRAITLNCSCGGAAPEIVAETETGDRLRITCEGDDYLAREEPPLHLFFCDRFCELESHGPTRLLYPGERISLSEQWTP